MRITGLEIDGFGVWSGLELADLSDQLNVFYGPNEAGKTTLMQFIRSVLYGFSPQRRARYLPPVRAGRPGGSIRAAGAQGTFTISRHADSPRETGELAVLDAHGQRHDGHLLDEILGEVDESIFTSVFAFGLREIQELGTLSDTQAAHLLYDLTLGLGRVSLVDVLGELESSRNRLLAADDRPSIVVQLLAQRQHLQAEIDELCQLTPRYLELARQCDHVEQEIGKCQTESDWLDQQWRVLAVARLVGANWQRRAALDQRLAGLKPLGPLGDDAPGRFDQIGSRLAAGEKQYARIQRRRRQLRAEADGLAINDALSRHAARLEALGEQQQWIGSLANQIRQTSAEIDQLQTRLQESQLPAGADAAAAAAASSKALTALRAQARPLLQMRRQLRDETEQIIGSRQSADTLGRQIQASLGRRANQGLVKALDQAGQLVSQLRHRVQIDERLDKMSRHEAELEEQSHRWLDRQLLPAWMLVSLGSLFVLGFALILAGLFMPASVTGAFGWPLAILGVAGMAVAGLTKWFTERSAAAQLDTCQRQMARLREQTRQTQQERDDLDKQLPRGGGPLVSRLQTAETEMAALEELLPLEAQREGALRQARGARERRRAAKADMAKARERWRQALAQVGLPTSLTPGQLRHFFRNRQEIHQLSRRLDQCRGDLAEQRGQFDAVAARIIQLSSDAGLKAPADDPLSSLSELLRMLHEQESLLKRRDALCDRTARLRRRQRRLARSIDKLRRRRQLILRQAGADDEQEFRTLAVAHAEAGRLRREHAALSQEIAARLAGKCSEETIAEYLKADHNIERLEQELGGSRQAAQSRLQASFERRGELHQQLTALAEDRRLAGKQLELATVERRLADALDRWRVLAVCSLVLESVREVLERDHQPEALREASGYLQRLTGGRYSRVWTPLGQHVLRVDDAAGHSLSVEVLSRGTREQLFLSLRLALVSSYARRGIRLPLVLDDVLVNFDAPRAKAAAAVLRDFAKSGQQLLIFTCHEHISKLFKTMRAEVRQLPDNAHPPLGPPPLAEARAAPARPAEPELPRAEPVEPVEPVKKVRRLRAEPVAESISAPIIEAEPEARVALPRPRREREPVAAAIEIDEDDLEDQPPVAQRGRRALQVDQIVWPAEEFAGELTDRTSRRIVLDEPLDDRAVGERNAGDRARGNGAGASEPAAAGSAMIAGKHSAERHKAQSGVRQASRGIAVAAQSLWLEEDVEHTADDDIEAA